MLDLAVSSAVLLLASAATGLLGARVGRRASRRAANLLAIGTLAFLLLFAWRWSGSVQLARLVPTSGAVVLADAVLPTTALLAGLAWARLPGGAARRTLLIAPLLGLCAYRSFGWVLDERVALADRWRRGVCVQTSTASCSAAAAATLLRAHGVHATEREMADLCLTRAGGTPMLGLYRGLVLKTAGTRWRVEVFHGDAAALRRSAAPAILSVGLPRNPGPVDPRYERKWGWAPGVRHTVVAFGFAGDDRVEIGDPSVGREHWSARDLNVLWPGDGLRLVER